MSEATALTLEPIEHASVLPKPELESPFIGYPAEFRTAVVAAVATGQTYRQVAEAFTISTDTVHRWVEANKRAVHGPENPLNWRERHAACAITLDDDVEAIKDPAKRHAAKLAMLKGLGLYGNDNQVTVKLEQWLGSPIVQRITAEFKTSGPEHSLRPEEESLNTTTGCDDLPNNGAKDGK